MKILILTFYYPPDLCAGSFRAGQLVSALNKATDKDIFIEVISTIPNRYNAYKPENIVDQDNGNIKIHRLELPNHKSGMKDQAIAFLHYAKGVFKITRHKKYDLIFATSSRLMTAALGATLSKKNKTRLYLDIRDIFTDTIADVVQQKLLIRTLMPILKFLERWTYSAADEINLVSQGFIKDVSNISPKSSITTFTHGIDKEFLNYDFSRKSVRKKMLITYAGNFGESQGLHYIIPFAASAIKDFAEIKLIGDGGKKTELISAIKNHQVDNVEICDPVNRDSLLIEYSNTDILFLCLNDKAAFLKVLPSKLFEYAATGKPILAGVSGYAAKFINENIVGCEVFPPGDSNKMIEKLDLLIKGPKSYNREAFKCKFSRENIMLKYAKKIIEN
ncbi:glycosyltransferase family 4 protein [Pelagibacterales bacterium]|nr:glycosyltransferase family 4 protein [Pelagibacterales bacterium]